MSDPRVFFAAERTLLAWIRTGITLMGLGFVVARFGLFLNLLARSQVNGDALHVDPTVSGWLGVILVAIGVGMIALASLQHHRFISSLPSGDFPSSYSRSFAIYSALAVAVVGALMVGYLIRGIPH
jgi:putative membrane protein